MVANTPRFLLLPLRRTRAVLVLAVLSAIGATPALAQGRILKADEAFTVSATRGTDGGLSLSWRIAPGTYLYRESLKAGMGGASVPLALPPGEQKDDPNFGPVEIYHRSVTAEATGLPTTGALDVTFQGCAEQGVCYPAVTRRVDLSTLAVSAARPPSEASNPGAPVGEARGAAPQGTAASPPEPAATPEAPAQPAQPAAMDALFQRGLLPLLGAFFGLGLLLAFTPCVFPMLPILSGILAGGGAKPTPARGLALSGAYGLAMAAAYGVLGMTVAWTGANLQAALQTPWAIGLMAAVFVVLAGAMFGLIDLAVPSALMARLPSGGRGSISGAAGLGFASALVVGPCVTPPLAAAMLYAAQTGDAARGASALFMLGLGMATPLVAVGAFGAQILPRSGRWLVATKQGCGVLFLAIAAWLAARVLPDAAGLALYGLLAIGLGVFAGGFDALASDADAGRRIGKTTGIAAVASGLLLLVGAAGGANDPLRPLGFLAAPARSATAESREVRVSSPAALTQALAARQDGRPTLVSFTADWCTVCKSNETAMAAPAAAARLSGLDRIAVDVTRYGDGAQALMGRYAVIGPPTLFLLDPTGREVPGSRRVGALTLADIDHLAIQAGL
ncbi:protein-disulfide reductase DsbD [Xanthobacter dioxanivorans]|uniref:Protein-disulfide reductase DsbD n=1 Tax=Xanthobacter dioxanivorans TaxID=2528964 RepID=A0A974PKC6_9HYPH|nr:protein-disulfide reductase DsbD [Xanthobacter dioxanivorans]QRG04655.1 protein-disulfide reductase DsbD [Xanthobacter dioxanivorans]